MNIAIRVDASAAIGTGHARRMAALSKALHRAGAGVTVVHRDLGIDVRPYFADSLSSFVVLPAPARPSTGDLSAPHGQWAGVSQEEDAIDTVEALQQRPPDWVVVDHYSFAADWHDMVRGRLGSRLAVIDDLADRPLSADLVIDHNFHPDHEAKYALVNRRSCPLLAGPRYAMLDEIYGSAPRYRFEPDVQSIGIFMGGVDAIAASGIALDAIDRAGIGCSVEVVSTHANPHLEDLARRISAAERHVLTLDLPDLAGFYARHDLQIGAGGGALWERMCIGAPTLAAICAANQRESIPYLADMGAVHMVDAMVKKEAAVDAIERALRRLIERPAERLSLHRRGIEMVDGKGTKRIAGRMLAVQKGDG